MMENLKFDLSKQEDFIFCAYYSKILSNVHYKKMKQGKERTALNCDVFSCFVNIL